MFLQKVVDTLNKHRVKYALVGGYAVALHGAVRGTVDVDVVITHDRRAFKNTERALKHIGLALKHIGLDPRLPVTAEELFDFRDEYTKNKNLVEWSFVNYDNPLEMVDVIITESLADLKTVRKTATGFDIKIVAIDDLIAINEKSNRKQDREDIKALRKLR